MSTELDQLVASLPPEALAVLQAEGAAAGAKSFKWTPISGTVAAPAGGRTQRMLGALGMPTSYPKPPTTGFTRDTAIRNFAGMGPEDRRKIQQALYDGGFFNDSFYTGKDSVRWGQYDIDSVTAFERAAELANYSGDLDLVLSQRMSPAELATRIKGAGRERAPLTVELSNPADIRKVGDTIGQQVIGRKLTDAEVQRLVSYYQGQERGAQTAAYGAAEGGGTVTQQASPQVAAEEFIRTQAPVEAGAHDIATQFSNFLDILGGMR